MRLYLIIPLFFLTSWSLGQSLTISGKARDRMTQEPLSFASVSILGKSISTVTNLNGEFDFHLPAEYRNEILVISMLGYTNFEAPVWSLVTNTNKQQIFDMEKSSTLLEEVVVEDTLTGGDILRIAMSRIEENYPMKPFMLNGFYRDAKKVGGTYISLLEAAVNIYDEDYAEPRNRFRLRERVRLIEVRQSLGYESRFTTFFDQDNLLEDLLLHNNIRYRQFENDAEFLMNVDRERDSYYNGHPIFVVTYQGAFSLTAYVDKRDYSIIHLEYQTGPTPDVINRKKGLYCKFDGLKKTIDFKRFQGKMYLNLMTLTSKINWYDSKTNVLNFETELYQQLLINKVFPETTERITSTEKMKNYGLQYQDHPYNKDFWDNYNVIKETPLDRKILVDLEKLAPLDKQFEN
jgi:CarboxypepD_reg-like domain